MAAKRVLWLTVITWSAVAACASGSGEAPVTTDPTIDGVPLVMTVEAGEHYLHTMRIMPLVNVRNAPQMAAWTETRSGEFVETLFVTGRIARQEWRGAPGDSTPAEEIRRAEALPVWAHARNAGSDATMLLPTREAPAPDAVTAATPKRGFDVRTSVTDELESVVVYFEVNASTDFNAAYPKDARPGAAGYSGGEWGSGQPSLVYRGIVTPARPDTRVELELVGHGSPDGSDGEIHGDLGGITTALQIVDSVVVNVAREGGR
jgi:hypothetical protein